MSALFSFSTDPKRNPERFCRFVWERISKDAMECRRVGVPLERISESDKVFWVGQDQCWAWYMVLIGHDLQDTVAQVGGTKAELVAWAEAVCRGEEQVAYEGLVFPTSWNKRQDRILKLLRESGQPLYEAARLLGRQPEEVKRRAKELRL